MLRPIRVALSGASGRMGRNIARAIIESKGFKLVAATDHPKSPDIGFDVGKINGLEELGVIIEGRPFALVNMKPDVIIDFTVARASVKHAELAAEYRIPMVIGTTGHSKNQMDRLRDAAEKCAIVLCSNTSIGVGLLSELVSHSAIALEEDWDIEIVETHHRDKIDAPSGTAIDLGKVAAEGRGVRFRSVYDYDRQEDTGEHRAGRIGFSVMRAGDVVGEHRVIFHGHGERIELTHRITDRMIFARGALRAVRWVLRHGYAGRRTIRRKPGIYLMTDVLFNRRRTIPDQ